METENESGFRFGLKHLMISVGLLCIFLAATVHLVEFVNRCMERLRIEEEAVWVSRYLGDAKGDYKNLALNMESYPPPIGNEFFLGWREAEAGQKISGKSVATYRSSTFDGLQLTVYNDLSFEWVDPELMLRD